MRLAFDIETNGLDDANVVHCLVAIDLDTHTVHKFEPSEVERGLSLLMEADQLIGHNIIGYDLPTIQRIHPSFVYDRAKVIDTLVLSRLIWTDLSDLDFQGEAFKKPSGPSIGSHALKAWGERLGYEKLEFSEWETFSPTMLAYCVVDVEVTVRLWKVIQGKAVDPRASELEHLVAFICAQQERYGFCFDEAAAQQLAITLGGKLANLEQELQDTIKPFYLADGPVKVPKRTTNGKVQAGTWAGAPYQKIKLTIFNPASRHHIANRLSRLYHWKPKEFTPSGQPKIDDTVLDALPWKEAKLLTEYFLVQKRQSLLMGEDGKGWLNVSRNPRTDNRGPRVHGSIITNGAVTGRGTHRIIANIPRVTTPYGKELRALFTASPGREQVGIDVSGLELRMLAHFLAKWDEGAYARIVCEGDPHAVNRDAAGLPDRDKAKTFIYAFLYGAGDAKIGSIVNPNASEKEQRRIGKKLKAEFTKKTPGLGKLLEAVEKAAARGYLIGLDGRRIKVRSSHAALNCLLQGSGAVLCKRWMVEVDLEIQRRNWHNVVQQLIWYHDELQYDVEPEYADEFGKMAVECIQRAGDYFGIRVPLTGEYKVGNNWKECH